jgi:methyl-accepting chemotaxis protein
MKFLNSIRIAPKILSVIVLLSVLAAGLSALGISSLRNVFEESKVFGPAFDRSINSGRATSNLLSYARGIEFLPFDHSAEERVQYEKDAADEAALFIRRIEALEASITNEAGRKNLANIRAQIARYKSAAGEVAAIARTGDYKKSMDVAVRAADTIGEIRKELRQIEDRNAKFTDDAEKTIAAVYDNAFTVLVVSTVTGVAIGFVLALFIVLAGITRPLGRMTAAMTEVAGGNLEVAVPALGQRDEVGHLAAALEKFKEAGQENRRLVAEQEEAKKRAEIEKKAAMNKMADEFESSVKGVVQIVSSASTELQSTAQSMSATAEETQRQSTAVAAASEQASTNVQTVASAAEELSSSITEISRQVTESTRISGQAVADAERTNVEIQGLSEAAQKIGDVVKLINDIAGQTNLLALNATIEAARAGEAGRGFAVVASEVKNLAGQTAKATEEISSKIAEIQAATGRSVTAVQGIGQTIGRINEIATTIASAVEEQGAATQEIARNVQQASAGTAEVSSNIVGVTKAANDTGAASTQVLGASGELSKQSETLRGEVDGFLTNIRAA